jgi:membrane associated rhomboid family serine protease
MNQITNALQAIILSVKQNSLFILGIISLLILLNIINRILGNRLNLLGIIPRTTRGLFGIFFSPFLHRDFNHLFFNSIPLFVLANLVLLNGRTAFYIISLMIIVLSGFGIWAVGRRAIHIGASSLIMGYFGYLLANAYFQINATTIVLGVLCLYYFGGLIAHLIPGEEDVSWEGHILGFLSGVATAYWGPTVINFFATL